MNKEAQKTEQLIQIYKEDPVKENLNALIHQMQKTIFLVPANLPDSVDKESLKKEVEAKQGGHVQLPEGVSPIPCILKNPEGRVFIPIYSSQTQIPKEPVFDFVMTLPFRACYSMALNAKAPCEGVTLNPFSDNLLFKRELLEAIRKDEEARAAGMKQVKVSPKQYHLMMRQKAEFHDLPLRVFKEGAPFIYQLSDEKETLVNSIYQNAFQNPKLYPFSENDFEVMPLNINEELLLIRLDLPEVKIAAQLCYRIYITLNPKDEKVIHYFTIERGKEKGERNLGGILSDGKHCSFGEAPVEGAEIQRIMDMLEQEKEKTS